MIQETFDKVFIINVASYKERRLTTKKRLEEKLGMVEGRDYEFFRATTGRSKFAKFNGKAYQGWNRNAAGLVHTTKRIIQKAKKEGWKSVFIMEDDVDFIPGFDRLWKAAIDDLPEEYDFFHINSTHDKQPKWYRGLLHRLRGAWCCQAYAVHESVYDKYLEELERSVCPIDQITLNLHGQRMKSYCTKPNLVLHHENNWSSLREKVVEY
jgi:GR25 family glycosyltransferase involved in LPS biosynthesis